MSKTYKDSTEKYISRRNREINKTKTAYAEIPKHIKKRKKKREERYASR
jgi:hypothetical protein